MTRQDLIQLAASIKANKASKKDEAVFIEELKKSLKELRQAIASAKQN
jgi:hypothetical protein